MPKMFQDARGLWTVAVELPPAPDGTRRRKYIRRKSKTALRAALDEVEATIRKKGDVATSSPTVSAWADYWMTDIVAKNRRPKTVASYRSVIENHIVPVIGGTRLDKLNAAAIRKVLARMESGGLSSTYRRNAHGVMAAMFADAEREEKIDRNPVDLVLRPRKAVADLEVLTVEEAQRLLETFSASPDAYMWATFILTGARRGEIIGLEWDRIGEDIDLSWQLQRLEYAHGCRGRCGLPRPSECPKRRFIVPEGFEHRHLQGGLHLTRPKSRAGWRIIPLVDPLRSILDTARESATENPWGLAFVSGRAGAPSPIDPDDATARWNATRDAAGIDRPVRLHDLRHTTVDLLDAAEVDMDTIMDIVGHSTRAMSREYRSKANRERMRKALLAMSASLGYPGQ
ncbi:site-specific integrase [Microbacterium sp. 5K110]|uniref:tyrosine-type recombinase/integrase n=1 Tax=Microbacterium sp. 5K110 TaxID=2578104 RepID=UPI0010FF50C0|nr:site-specific integrase [Microbacterium sp. 5K110]TLF33208.1 hypothetical protein FE256_03690 [Microbacterium sp. 5K110]